MTSKQVREATVLIRRLEEARARIDTVRWLIARL